MTFTIPDDLADQIESLAERESREPIDLLRKLVSQYEAQQPKPTSDEDPLEQIVGALDVDVDDMSVTVRETMTQFYKDKHAGTD